MKALIGIDTGGCWEPAVRLFGRLKFDQPDTTLLNVVDFVLPYTSFGTEPGMEGTAEIVDGLKEAGAHAVGEAKGVLAEYGDAAKTNVISGPAVLTLIDEADRMDADVVGIASTRKGALAALFTGSMSRSMISACRHSVLVAKEGVAEQGPVEVVFATDQSPYAARALDRFLQLAPKGISKVNVVTAYTHIEVDNEFAMEGAALLLEERARAIVGTLSQHGYNADYKVAAGDINQVIEAEMARTGSELLIVGAQGHGFFERLFVGSISFHQVVAEPYSVFVIRA